MRVTWLADVLRAAGLPVVEMDGWKSRGKELTSVQGVVCHHLAAGPSLSDLSAQNMLRDGHSNLAGPLAQCGLRRDGTWVVVAAGKCNHNGFGTWGNQAIGVEAYNDGVGEPWPEVQYESYARGVAAIAKHLGYGTDRVKGHKETDPDRKIDPTFDMDAFRRRVAHHQAGAPAPTPPEEDFMAALTDTEQRELLEKVRATDLRVTQLQNEVVGVVDDKGQSRMDRLVKRIDEVRAALKPKA